jgi:hypothetical protein
VTEPLKADICYHINVPDMSPDGTAVLFEFRCKHLEGDDTSATDSTVSVWLPDAVLQSWVNVLPKILDDMMTYQAQRQ